MKNQISCDVIGDLYPVYSEGMCSSDTKALVEAHLAECADCRKAFAELPAAAPAAEAPGPEDTFRKLNRSIRLRRWLLAFLLALLTAIVCVICFHIEYLSLRKAMGVITLTALFLFLGMLLRAIVQSIAVIVLRVSGRLAPEKRRSEYGGTAFLWLAAALLGFAAVTAAVIYEFG